MSVHLPHCCSIVQPGYFETLGIGSNAKEQNQARYQWCQENLPEIDSLPSTLFEDFTDSLLTEPIVPLGQAEKTVRVWSVNGEIDLPEEPRKIRDACLEKLSWFEEMINKQYKRHPIGKTRNAIEVVVDHDKVNNAFWDHQSQKIYFGKVTYAYFKPDGLIKDPSIVGHELGHAYTFYYGSKGKGLDHQGETGAIGESIADVAGIELKHIMSNTKANDEDADWRIGTVYRNCHGFEENYAFRSMRVTQELLLPMMIKEMKKVITLIITDLISTVQ